MNIFNRTFIFHTFNGGQLGNHLRLSHDLLIFSRLHDLNLVFFSNYLYKISFCRRPFFYYGLIRHRPQKYLYLLYLYLNLFFFRLLLWLLYVFPFFVNILLSFIPADDVAYFGFNVTSASTYYCLDDSFLKSLRPLSFLWGYHFFIVPHLLKSLLSIQVWLQSLGSS